MLVWIEEGPLDPGPTLLARTGVRLKEIKLSGAGAAFQRFTRLIFAVRFGGKRVTSYDSPPVSFIHEFTPLIFRRCSATLFTGLAPSNSAPGTNDPEWPDRRWRARVSADHPSTRQTSPMYYP